MNGERPDAGRDASGAPGPAASWIELIRGRRNFTPRRLEEPGLSSDQLATLLEAAAAAPDHGEISPWRFVFVSAGSRERLGEVFRAALLERDPAAAAEQQAIAREKALRAPCLLLAVIDLGLREKPVPALERYISLGCAIQNMLLIARALGYDSGLSCGQALKSKALRGAFSLADTEVACCSVSFGSAAKNKPPRIRPAPSQICTVF